MAAQRSRIVIVGDTANGQAEYMRLFLSRLATPSDVTIVTPQKYDPIQLIGMHPDLTFYILDNEPFSLDVDGILARRQPSKTISRLWDLVARADDTFPIHVGIPESRFISPELRMRISALDTLSLILSGVAGIWEISLTLMGSDSRFHFDMDTLNTTWRHKSSFLYGHPAQKLYEFQSSITGSDWPTQVDGADGEHSISPAYVKYCFEVALSVASLTVEEMQLGDGEGGGMEPFSRKILSYADRTGCARAEGTVTQALRYLDRGWSERVERYDKKWRSQMPICAQIEGFPAHLPLIRGVDANDTWETLFENLEKLDFSRTENGKEWEPNVRNPYHTTVRV